MKKRADTEISLIPAASLSDALASEWRAIQRMNPGLDNPLFHPEFTRVAGQFCPETAVAVLRENGQAAAFFPFQRHGRRAARAVVAEMSDFHGIIAPAGAQPDVRQLLRACGLCSWQFDHLPADQAFFQPYHNSLDDSPYMDLRGGYDGFVQQKSDEGSSVIKQAERKARKLSREIGELRFVWHTPDPAITDLLADWKAQQLIAANYANVFQLKWLVPLLKAYHQTATAGFSGIQSVLYAGDAPVAIHSGFLGDVVFSSWIPAYNADFSRYSPGLLLHIELAKHAATLGVQRIDLCRGYNQLKRSLMSGAFPVAIGKVTVSPLRQTVENGIFQTRQALASAAFFRPARHLYRRFRTWKYSIS